MKRYAISALALLILATAALAQVEKNNSRRRDRKERGGEQQSGVVISDRMQSFYENKEPHDADLAYSRTIYRQLDLQEPENQPLYFPEDVVDGKSNLFRVMMNLVVSGDLPAYEYLDGRELFTDQYRVNVGDMLDRFGIYYSGSGDNIKVEESDVPTTQVLNYYIIEKWEFDRRTNRMKTRVEAICPVLNRYGDYGGEAKYPMFWVKFDSLRPYLAQQYVFLSDDNNLEQYSLDDYFNLGMYKGDIYKTKNLRNQSMVQMYPNEDDLKHAQDSIDNRLKSFGSNLWVPTREEFMAQQKAEAERAAAIAAGDTLVERDASVVDLPKAKSKEKKEAPKRAVKKRASTKVQSSSSNGNSSAAKSVRRRKK